MKIIDAGTSGKPFTGSTRWQDLGLGPLWEKVIEVIEPGSVPRPVQVSTLRDYKILDSRKNLVVSAPTNGGKSLVGLLTLLNAIRQGMRGVLLEPMRALAREKTDELESKADKLSELLKCPIKITISTGDYHLDDEMLSSPPPNTGEIIIATPERMESILRNTKHENWWSSIGAICADEAHLLGSFRRGPTLEYLLTSYLCLPFPPRIVLLSATMGNLDKVCNWLAPCESIAVSERHPVLHKQVFALEAKEDANQTVLEYARQVLSDADANLLVFVYQVNATNSLAKLLTKNLGTMAGVEGALAYNAQMNASQRESVREAFCSGQSRCVITTTALALGVNLPATHVVVRDPTFQGVKNLEVGELLQMMGRAGRGNQSGNAAVIVRPKDGWNAKELAGALKGEKLPPLISSLERAQNIEIEPWEKSVKFDIVPVATSVASYLARTDREMTEQEIRDFFARSLGGKTYEAHICEALNWLCDSCRVICFCNEENRYGLTTLGKKAVQRVLPLPLVAGYAQLLRDFISIDPESNLLQMWKPLDHMIVVELLLERSYPLRNFSEKLVSSVDGWMERAKEVPLLYRDWIKGLPKKSKANQILGSLGIRQPNRKTNVHVWARKQAYLATFRAIVLYERSKGETINNLQRYWAVKNLEGIEERWRDDYLWILPGLSQVLEIRCFYYHLREECKADDERVKTVKRYLGQMRSQVLRLTGDLKYCSPLGFVLLDIKRSMKSSKGLSVGVGSIRKLEQAGINSLPELAKLPLEKLIEYGVKEKYAKQICNRLRRRFM